jgi:hypothetical protein
MTTREMRPVRPRSRSRSRQRSPNRLQSCRSRRSRSNSRSRSPYGSRRRRSEEDFKDCAERTFRVRVQEAADAKVEEYVRSEEFSVMVEALKRRERERILAEVQREMETEKKRLITEAKERMMQELSTLRQAETIPVVSGSSDTGSDADLADAILLQNTLKMEEQQRRAFLQKQEEDAKRLEQVLHNKRLEVISYLCVQPLC